MPTASKHRWVVVKLDCPGAKFYYRLYWFHSLRQGNERLWAVLKLNVLIKTTTVSICRRVAVATDIYDDVMCGLKHRLWCGVPTSRPTGKLSLFRLSWKNPSRLWTFLLSAFLTAGNLLQGNLRNAEVRKFWPLTRSGRLQISRNGLRVDFNPLKVNTLEIYIFLFISAKISQLGNALSCKIGDKKNR